MVKLMAGGFPSVLVAIVGVLMLSRTTYSRRKMMPAAQLSKTSDSRASSRHSPTHEDAHAAHTSGARGAASVPASGVGSTPISSLAQAAEPTSKRRSLGAWGLAVVALVASVGICAATFCRANKSEDTDAGMAGMAGESTSVVTGTGTLISVLENRDSGMSMITTIAQCVQTIMGAGILTTSWAFWCSSMWPGLIFSMAMCLLAAYGFYVMGTCSEVTGKKVFGEIWQCAFGVNTAWIPNAVSLVVTWLSLVAYMTIIGDYVPRAIQDFGFDWPFFQDRRRVIVLVWTLMLPLHFLKDLSILGFTSLLGTCGTTYTCLLLSAKGVGHLGKQADWEPFKIRSKLFLAVPALAFTFNGHFNAPYIYQRLKSRSPARWQTVTAVTFSICFLIATACGVSGYVMFGSELSLPGRSNVLNAPQFEGLPEVMLSMLATSLTVTMSLPLYSHSTRDALELLFLFFSGSAETLGSSRTRSNLAMITCLVSSLCVALVVRNLGLINAVCGALACSLNMFVLPALMHMKLSGMPPRQVSTGSQSSVPSFHGLSGGFLPWTAIVVGVIIAVTGVTISIMDAMGISI